MENKDLRHQLLYPLKVLKKRRRIFMGTILGFILCAALITLNITPTYESETTIRAKDPSGLMNAVGLTSQSSRSGQQMLSYTEIIKSRSVVQEVINKTQVPTSYESLAPRITTEPVANTDVLKIKVRANTPEEAQLLANSLTEAFQNKLTDWATSEQTAVRNFVGARLEQSREELDKAEIALQEYKSANKMADVDSQTKDLASTISGIKKLASDNAVSLAAAQGKLAYAKQELADENPGFIADNPLIQQYQTKLADQEVQLVTKSQKYTSNHPNIIAAKAAIEETRRRLNQEIIRVINAEAPSMNPVHQALLQSRSSAESDIAANLAQQGAIQSFLGQSEQEFANLQPKERELAKVMRDVSVAREIYIMLAKRYEEAKISEVMHPAELQLIDSATLPAYPIAPRNSRNILLGALLGLVTGIGLIIITELLNQRVRTEEDIKQYLDLPILASIPPFDKQYKAQRTGLLGALIHFILGKI